MAETEVYRVVGPIQTLTLTRVTQAPLSVTCYQGETFNYAGFINAGNAPAIVTVAQLGKNPENPVFPTSSSGPVTGIMLPPLMIKPLLYQVPSNGFTMAAVTNSAAPTLFFVQPYGAV